MEHCAIPVQRLEAAASKLPGLSQQLQQDSAPLYHPNTSQIDDLSNTTVANPTTDVGSRHSFQASPISLASSSSPSSKVDQHPKGESLSNFSKWSSEWIINWWGIEIACWVIAVLSLVAIVITLESHKNQPVPQWSLGITLNSCISIFATIGQMAMAKPLVECISQLKWLWFERKEKLSGFQAIDDASRGPTGSLVLLWKLHGTHLVSLGAAIMVVSAAFGPFAQQIVTYPSRLHTIGPATVPQVFNFTAGSATQAGQCSPDTLAAIEEGISIGNFSLSAVTPSCTTGNCSWVEYSSLGICSSSSDLSTEIITNTCNLTSFEEIFDSINITNPGYPCFNYTLPYMSMETLGGTDNGWNTTNATLLTTFSPWNPGEIQIMTLNPSISNSSSVASLYVMYQPGFSTSVNSSLPSPIAYGLNLNLCVQTYSTTVSNGAVNTTMLSSQIIETNTKESFFVGNNSLGWAGNDSYVSIGNNTFGISSGPLLLLSTALGSLYAACYETLGSAMSAGPENETWYCEVITGLPFLQVLQNSSDPFFDVTQKWDNLAISMTNSFRTGAGGDTLVGLFNGKALTPIPYVETNYLWLILPASLVALTLVLLVATILKSQRLGSRVWKSSNLATLQGLHGELHAKLGGMSSITEMEEKAKDVKVRFNLDLKSVEGEHAVEYRLVESKQEAYWRG